MAWDGDVTALVPLFLRDVVFLLSAWEIRADGKFKIPTEAQGSGGGEGRAYKF